MLLITGFSIAAPTVPIIIIAIAIPNMLCFTAFMVVSPVPAVSRIGSLQVRVPPSDFIGTLPAENADLYVVL